MSAVTNSLHANPVSSMINNALDDLVDQAQVIEARSHSLQNKTLVVLSKTLFVAGNTLNLVVVAVETVASGIIGAVALFTQIATGSKSLAFHKFTLQSLSYCAHSASVPYMIYSMLFNKVSARPDLSTFHKHFQYGFSAGEIHAEFAPNLNYHAGRGSSFTQASGNQLFKAWLNNLIPAMKSAIDSSCLKHSPYERSLVPTLFALLLKEKNYEQTNTLNKESMNQVLELWNKALAICPVAHDFHPSIQAEGLSQFQYTLKRAESHESLTAEQLITMIAQGNGIFSTEEAPAADEHGAIRERIRGFPLGSECVRYVDRLACADGIYSALETNEVSDAKFQRIIQLARSSGLTLRIVLDLITEDEVPEFASPTRPVVRPTLPERSISRPVGSLPPVRPTPAPLSSDLIAPARILTEIPNLASAYSYDTMIRTLVTFAYEKSYRVMPHLYCNPPTPEEGGGSPVLRHQALEVRVNEGKENLSGMDPLALLGVAKYAQYLEIMHGTQICTEYTPRQAAITSARIAIRGFNDHEKRLLITVLLTGDTVEAELNNLAANRRALVKQLASDITKLSSAMTEAPREGNYFQKEYLKTIKTAYEQTYAAVAPTTT